MNDRRNVDTNHPNYMDLLGQHNVRVIHTRDWTAKPGIPRPVLGRDFIGREKPQSITFRDGTELVLFTDGSLRHATQRRRFTYEDGTVLSGRQLRIGRKLRRRIIGRAIALKAQKESERAHW